MSKRKYSENSYESHKFISEGPSCVTQDDYNNKNPQYYQNRDHYTSRNNKQDFVNKNNLYRNPKIFKDDQQKSGDLQNESKCLENNWTDQYWLKQNDIPTSTQRSLSGQRNVKKPKNYIERTLNKMFAQPAEMSKGKSLLEKMGWKGGGLGKDEDGIVDPIAPKATYATQTIGLGLLAENDYKQNGHGKRKGNNKTKQNKNNASDEAQFKENDLQINNYFKTNVLLKILEFVKNNSKTELLFEEKLSRLERKRIHHLVENVRECDNPELLDFDKDSDKEIVEQIILYNHYILNTESNGRGPKRRLCLYKEAPENVYLITPDYLREEIEENKSNIKNDITKDNSNKVTTISNERKDATNEEIKLQINYVNKPVKNSENDSSDICKAENGGNDMEVNIVSNFDINKEIDVDINKKQDGDNGKELNCKVNNKEYKEKEKCLEKIIEYFREFADESIYKEFRFLGDFNNEENDAITLFFDICLKVPVECEVKSELVQILSNGLYTFNIEEDSNGNLIIEKLQN